MYRYESTSQKKTLDLACRLGELLQGGEIIALEGDLGAGKTLFVKGLARGLKVEEEVTSPTFVLMHNYSGRLPLTHFDIYRLPFPEAIEELGYEEYFYGPGVTAIEWSDLVKDYLPKEYLQVIICRANNNENSEYREITFIPHGGKMESLVKELSVNAGFRY